MCDDSTGCKEAGDNDDFNRSRQQQTFNINGTWMRISLNINNKREHVLNCFVYLYFLFVALYLALYA